MPWLEPDVSDRVAELAKEGVPALAVVPIGFISDHMEVVYDLDTEAKEAAEEAGVAFARAATAGLDPRFVAMVRELVQERLAGAAREALGTLPHWDVCPLDCCPAPRRHKS